MTPEEQLLRGAAEWQEPIAVCLALIMFSFGFITINSLNS